MTRARPREPAAPRTAADVAAICEGKAALTAEQARAVLRRPGSREKRRIAYRCPVCRAWHVGRPPPKGVR